MRWGKVCLIINLIMVIASVSGIGVLYWLMMSEFHTFPEKNIWTESRCQVINNYQNGYYEVNIVDHQMITHNNQSTFGLCGWDETKTDRFNYTESDTNSNQSLNTVKCQIPPLPVIMAECTHQTPIANLILLGAQAEVVQERLERHLEYYWSAIACAITAMLCCFWCCYSYWFNWCGCQDQSYWYCGRRNYLQFFNGSNSDIEEDFRINFN